MIFKRYYSSSNSDICSEYELIPELVVTLNGLNKDAIKSYKVILRWN